MCIVVFYHCHHHHHHHNTHEYLLFWLYDDDNDDYYHINRLNHYFFFIVIVNMTFINVSHHHQPRPPIAPQRLDVRGRIKVLHGQNRKTEDPPLALFAVCTPFGPPSLLELPQKEVMYKSKHKLDLALVSMDQKWVLWAILGLGYGWGWGAGCWVYWQDVYLLCTVYLMVGYVLIVYTCAYILSIGHIDYGIHLLYSGYFDTTYAYCVRFVHMIYA